MSALVLEWLGIARYKNTHSAEPNDNQLHRPQIIKFYVSCGFMASILRRKLLGEHCTQHQAPDHRGRGGGYLNRVNSRLDNEVCWEWCINQGVTQAYSDKEIPSAPIRSRTYDLMITD